MLPFQMKRMIERVLDEDLADVGDITTQITVGADVVGSGQIVAREPMIVSGVDVAEQVFLCVDPALTVSLLAEGGQRLKAGEPICKIEGSLRSILTAERPALNFLGHLSGIATHTNTLVLALGESKSQLTATRKTTPGLRFLEKAAVRHGGASNHRFGLFDGILIKDNHVVACGGIFEAVAHAKANLPHHLVKIGVEVDRLDQIEFAIEAGANHLLLDNMGPAILKQAIEIVKGRVTTEASGGVSLKSIPGIAKTGVDFISSGGLIHQARWVDVGMDFDALSPEVS